ncbi:MAG: 16S rRNA (guanine(966)-N(2))-methyltransferase RsmD [Candidatus Saccharimonas sp.]
MTSVRLIAGRFGGRVLAAPPNDNTRTKPMGERIRNAMFNSIGSEIDGVNVLDAFAGTGSVGLEALSRGAKRVTFVEKDGVAQRILAENIAKLGVGNEVTLAKSPVASWCENHTGPQFDIILADPPYHQPQLSTVIKLFSLLKPNGLMVLSHLGRGEGPNLINGIVVVDNRSYGNAQLTFFRREE